MMSITLETISSVLKCGNYETNLEILAGGVCSLAFRDRESGELDCWLLVETNRKAAWTTLMICEGIRLYRPSVFYSLVGAAVCAGVKWSEALPTEEQES